MSDDVSDDVSEGLSEVPALSDAQLVQAMAGGDRSALAELYDRHAARLLATARRFLGTTSAAEDLVHDVLLEAWRRAESFDPDRGNALTWLLVRLRSRALDRLRRRQRGYKALNSLGHTQTQDTAPDPLRRSEYAEVRRALRELPETHRQVVDLGYFAGLSMSEIAEELAIPLGTVKSRTAAALARLRDALKADRGGAR